MLGFGGYMGSGNYDGRHTRLRFKEGGGKGINSSLLCINYIQL